MAKITERTEEIIKDSSLEFGERLVNLARQKKEIDRDIKELKKDFKMNGVDVSKIARAINVVKADLKKTDIARAEEGMYVEMVTESESIMISLNELVSEE